jgi:hypothetical protein
MGPRGWNVKPWLSSRREMRDDVADRRVRSRPLLAGSLGSKTGHIQPRQDLRPGSTGGDFAAVDYVEQAPSEGARDKRCAAADRSGLRTPTRLVVHVASLPKLSVSLRRDNHRCSPEERPDVLSMEAVANQSAGTSYEPSKRRFRPRSASSHPVVFH